MVDLLVPSVESESPTVKTMPTVSESFLVGKPTTECQSFMFCHINMLTMLLCTSILVIHIVSVYNVAFNTMPRTLIGLREGGAGV